ncbi:MAG: Csu type fimbrial protein [Gammaproteobacteria bacterium]
MKWLFWLAMILVALYTGTAHAYHCTFSKNNLQFGVYDPFSSSPNDTTSSIVVTCTSQNNDNGLAFTVNFTVNFTPGNSGTATQEYMLNNDTPQVQMNYNIYADPAHTLILGPGYNQISGSITVPAGSSGTSNSETFTVYGEVPAHLTTLTSGANPYADTLTALLSYLDQNGNPATNGPKNINVRANVQGSCASVTAGDVAFGTLDPSTVNSNEVVTSNVTVNCTNGTPFGVVMDAGLHAATPGDTTTRRMMDTTGDFLPYHLCTDSLCANEIGADLTGAYITGTGVSGSQSVVFYGMVKLSDLQVAPAGNYSDTVTVTLIY